MNNKFKIFIIVSAVVVVALMLSIIQHLNVIEDNQRDLWAASGGIQDQLHDIKNELKELNGEGNGRL